MWMGEIGGQISYLIERGKRNALFFACQGYQSRQEFKKKETPGKTVVEQQHILRILHSVVLPQEYCLEERLDDETLGSCRA
jgi:hypothetical protein